MRFLRKTFLTVTVSLFSVVLFAFATVLFTAACSNKVSMNFETFGGTQIAAISLAAGSEYEAPDDPEKEGCVFLGWYLDKSCEGESATLPDVMPETSVTYYAKYEECPVLTLETGGGTLDGATYYVRKGTSLAETLQELVPEKDGLVFGAWLSDGEILEEDAVMPEEDLTLTAKYMAAYSVEIFLQSASNETQFDLEETASCLGWEGETVTAEIPTYLHFLFDGERSTADSLTLTAGENKICFYYTRETVTIHFTLISPAGGQTSWEMQSYYGGSVTLPVGVCTEDGYVFYGWAVGQAGAASRFAGETITLGADDLSLYGVFAKTYSDGKGSAGTLAVSEAANADGTRNARFSAEGEEGVCGADGYFTVGNIEGRIDGYGYYLLSDSGVYTGYSLAENRADEAFGVLSLDFKTGTAVYTADGVSVTGSYCYEYDGELGAYTGNYRFAEAFYFRLDGRYFLQRGEEKGVYYLYDCAAGKYDGTCALVLDGFGGAVYQTGGECIAGTYYGGGEGEWIFSSDKEEFRLMTGSSGPSFGSSSKQVSVFLIYRAEWAGSYTSADGAALTLDGYGYSGVYVTESGTEEGVFSLSGNVVTLECGGQTYVFYLDASAGTFSR